MEPHLKIALTRQHVELSLVYFFPPLKISRWVFKKCGRVHCQLCIEHLTRGFVMLNMGSPP